MLAGRCSLHKASKKGNDKGRTRTSSKTCRDPFDSRCKDCLLGGIKDRPHYKRASDREENTLAIDIAGRFKPGRGEEGGDYKYLLVATFKAARGNWKEPQDEVTEEKQKAEADKCILVCANCHREIHHEQHNGV